MKLLNTPWRNGTVEGKLLNNTNKLSRSAYNIDFTSWIDSKLCSKNNRRPVNLSVNTWTVVVYCIIIHSAILVVTFPVFCSTLWNSQNHKHFNIFLYFYLFISNHKHLNIFLYFFTKLKNLPSLLFSSTNIMLSTLLILAVCRMHVIWTC